MYLYLRILIASTKQSLSSTEQEYKNSSVFYDGKYRMLRNVWSMVLFGEIWPNRSAMSRFAATDIWLDNNQRSSHFYIIAKLGRSSIKTANLVFLG